MSRNKKPTCVPHWVLNAQNIGKCLKYSYDKKLKAWVCSDTNESCPYKGVRDFGVLQERYKVPDWLRVKASKGGRNE